ncbi:hypothetical protein FRB99_000956 [Tulasnella sp. 403]|nr:hypothetical protein FRB99_000956 [Tulasnella sp. 403]
MDPANTQDKLTLRISNIRFDGWIWLSQVKETQLPRVLSRSLDVSDKPISVLISPKLGLIYVVTLQGGVHLIDIESGLLLHSAILPTQGYTLHQHSRILGDGKGIFTATDSAAYHIYVNEEDFIPYIRHQFKDDENLAMAISGRTGMKGAEDLWVKHYPN